MEGQWLIPLPKPDVCPTDIKCFYCDRTFRTEASERRHVAEEHEEESSLRCPACKTRRFKTPSDLMGHIERGVCERLSLEDLNRRRRRLLAFRQQLGLQGPVRDNFSRFIDKRAPTITQNHLIAGVGADVNELGRQSSVPSIVAATTTESSRAPSVLSARSDDTINRNMGLTLSKQQQNSGQQDLSREYDMVFDDLDEARESLDRCWNKVSEKYHCFHDRCPKTFKSKAALRGHLQSPAHSCVRYLCPECHRELHCLQGMTAHAEDTSSRCGIWKSDKFAIYMEQLTAGLVDVIFVDGQNRIKYRISQAAEAEFEDALVARFDGYEDFHKNIW